MNEYYKSLSPITVSLDQLLLDPNNPRYAELGESDQSIPESRYNESRIQAEAYDKMKSERFNVSELKDTIKTLGFLQMDRIVVRKWKCSTADEQLFVVIEGNRRITALKWLLDLHKSGKETFSDEQLKNFQQIDALLLSDDVSLDLAKWILPGLRHVSGIKEWGPYQKARTVYMLRESGTSVQDSAQSLGLSTRAANQLWRSFLALEQMKGDEEFGEFAQPRLYSFFEEIFKKPTIKSWLDWDDVEKRFRNESHLRELYSWMVGGYDDNGEEVQPKLPEAKSIRDLAAIINDERAMSILRSEGGSLSDARSRYQSDHPEEWLSTIAKADFALQNMTVDQLKEMTPQQIAALSDLKSRIDSLLSDRGKLV